jgi:hypothetical protein
MIAGYWLLAVSGYAQMQRERVAADGVVEEIFWTPNLVGMSTVENLGANSMNVTIMHNFGIVTDRPLQNFFGFDFGPNVRLGIDYGLTDRWSLGIGRTTFDKVVDLRTNVSILNQTTNGSVPLSISLKGNVALTTVENNRPVSDDLGYLLSLPAARKFNETFSFQLAPMYAHFNAVVVGSNQQKDLFALGIGGEVHLSRRYALMAEYYPVLGERNPGTKNTFSLGLNIETGGHVFQLYFASSQWHTEQFIIARNREDFWAGDFRFGFNVNRLFSL